ncbi:hypothetical protein B0H17DRAFT_919910 [Mycena rosella]|uniref:F-box domain-containing protein n=1 Tax=Mycena rosella TaxID=1033263 RepID=A0AAD7GUK4_MYCRO|nr:hypothetical protein B0H17DRAFT_919910 [Mycena rosella]
MFLFFPLELVHEIIAWLLITPTSAEQAGTNPKPKWSLIASFSSASKTYRTLALEAWFRVLFLRSPQDLLFLKENLQEIRSSWTRELHCIANYHRQLDGHPWDLAGFCRLQTIRLHCSSIVVVKERLPFINIPPSVMEVDLRDLTWPSPFVFQAITATFPDLRTLRLSQRRVWCGLCHTCSTVKFVEPVPSKLVYKEGFGLPIHYARALAPMRYLHTVRITIPYTNGTSIRLNPDDPAKDMWSGECEDCVRIMYADADFLERWIARKGGTFLSNLPGKDAERLYIKPPALETVEWTFWRSEIDDDEELEEEEDLALADYDEE